VKPFIKLSKMKKTLEGKHTYYEYPFRPYGISFMLRLINDFRRYGDSFYIRKHEFCKKDVTLGTHKDGLLFTLNKKELVLDFAERQKDGFYKKGGNIHFVTFKQFLGDGEWKYKRKVMSSLFNYEFIRSKFSVIVSIAKEICEEAKDN
jgi:hypothetical protein